MNRRGFLKVMMAAVAAPAVGLLAKPKEVTTPPEVSVCTNTGKATPATPYLTWTHIKPKWVPDPDRIDAIIDEMIAQDRARDLEEITHLLEQDMLRVYERSFYLGWPRSFEGITFMTSAT